MRGFMWATVVLVCLCITLKAFAGTTPKGTLNVHFTYTGVTKPYSASEDGVPLRCVQYFGPGKIYIVCRVAQEPKQVPKKPAKLIA